MPIPHGTVRRSVAVVIMHLVQHFERPYHDRGWIARGVVPCRSARMCQSDSDHAAFGLEDLRSPGPLVRFDMLVNLTTGSHLPGNR